MSNPVTDAMLTADAIDAALAPRVARCANCEFPVEPCNESEIADVPSRADSNLCRECYAIAATPACVHVCPECEVSYCCWVDPCDRTRVHLCDDCDRARGRAHTHYRQNTMTGRGEFAPCLDASCSQWGGQA